MGLPLSPRPPKHIMRRCWTGRGWPCPDSGGTPSATATPRDFIVGVRADTGLLQKSLGRRSITTTERLYGHFHDDVAARIARGRIYPEERIRAV
jgi:hypothetical protein